LSQPWDVSATDGWTGELTGWVQEAGGDMAHDDRHGRGRRARLKQSVATLTRGARGAQRDLAPGRAYQVVAACPGAGLVSDGVERAGHARLTATDRGPGIPPEAWPSSFRRFYRSRPVRAGHGIGLGLAIGRAIIDAHGERVGATPTTSGARIWIELPRLNNASAVGLGCIS